MKWLKENYFKAGILIAVFALPYFLYFLPVVQPQLQLQSEIAACNQKGTRFNQQFDSQSLAENSNIESFVPPQYHFNQQMDVCLVENGFVFPDHGGTGTYMQLTNADTNKIVLQSAGNIWQQSDASQNVLTYQEFMNEAPSYMSQ
ncbi:MAG: hypothetical protein ACREGH_00150 [Minisyncoccia bacterium]